MDTALEEFKQVFSSFAVDNKGLSEQWIATFIVWFLIRVQGEEVVQKNALMERLSSIGRTNVNYTRLKSALSKSKYVSYHLKTDSLVLRLEAQNELDAEFSAYKKPRAIITDNFIDNAELLKRPYLASMMSQINGAYHYQLYDCCAVMMRRLMESLLIEVFQVHSALAEIKNGKDLKMLRDIIAAVKSTSAFHVSRNFCSAAEKIKELGDLAAHDRYHMTKKADIDGVALNFRKMLSEIIVLAKI